MKDVIYVPFNPDDLGVMKLRRRLLEEFLNRGWELAGSVVLTDSMGERTRVWVLTRPVGGAS